jgi:hypothetical protein
MRDIHPYLPSVRALLFVSSLRYLKLRGMLLDKASFKTRHRFFFYNALI